MSPPSTSWSSQGRYTSPALAVIMIWSQGRRAPASPAVADNDAGCAACRGKGSPRPPSKGRHEVDRRQPATGPDEVLDQSCVVAGLRPYLEYWLSALKPQRFEHRRHDRRGRRGAGRHAAIVGRRSQGDVRPVDRRQAVGRGELGTKCSRVTARNASCTALLLIGPLASSRRASAKRVRRPSETCCTVSAASS